MSTNICKLKIPNGHAKRSSNERKEPVSSNSANLFHFYSGWLVPMANLNYIYEIKVQLPEIKGIHPTQIAS